MKRATSDKIAWIKDHSAERAHSELNASQKHSNSIEAAMLLGAVGAMQVVAEKLTAQSFRALEQFAANKGHEALGFERFDDFLNESHYSPMSKNQYYDRKALLEKEGDSAFDVLNSLRVPISTRKLLSDGTVKLEGDTITVGEESFPVSDRARVAEAFRKITDKSAEQSRTIERGKKENTNLKKKLDAAKKQSASHPILSDNPHAHALTAAVTALANLCMEAERLSLAEAINLRDQAIELIAEQRLRLEEAYRFDSDPTTDEDRALLSDSEIDELAKM